MRHLLLIFTAFIVFTSCTSIQEGFRLKTVEQDNLFYIQGREFVTKEIDSFKVSVGFETCANMEYVFNVTVENLGNKPYLFDPSLIYIEPESPVYLPYDRYFAINPEQRLEAIDDAIYREKRNIETNRTISIIGGVATIAGAIAADDEDKADVIYAGEDFQYDMAYARQDSKNRIVYMNDDKEYWRNYAIRRTTVFPSKYHSGVFHIYVDYAPYFNLFIPIEDKLFVFRYMNDKYYY